MSFTASSPARVSVTRDVVDDRSMRSMSPWNFSPQPFGLSQSPSSAMATAASSEVVDDDLVVVEVPVVETPVVERLFLDNKKEIEFLGQKGPSNTEVESEVDEPVQPVHDPWSAARFNALAWGGVDPPVDLDVLHRALIRVDDHQGNHWLKALTIEDKLDLATSTLNAVQPKIQQLHRDLCQEATASEHRLKIRLGNIERLLDHVLKRMDRGVERDTRLVTRSGSKPYSVKKPRYE